MSIKKTLGGFIIFIAEMNSVLAADTFKTAPISVENAHSSLNIVHNDRHESGGFSTLWVSPDCSELITISDYSQVNPIELDKPVKRSGWYQADIHFDGDKLASLSIKSKGQLKTLDGSILEGAAESMEWDGKGFLVSFDGRGDIFRYSGEVPEGKLLNTTPVIAYKQNNLGSGNNGLEAMTVLESGEVFALWEKNRGESFAHGRILDKDKQPISFQYDALRNPGGATTLSDGSLLILEKQWLGLGKGQMLRLVKLHPDNFSNIQTKIKGETIFDEKSLDYDNNEGVSSCKRGNKEWVFVITDDNGDWPKARVEDRGKTRQRTLLMQFDLESLTQ